MKIHSFNVIPNLPENLKPLGTLADNMWFTWNWDAIMMFLSIDEDLWHKSRRNPKWILGYFPPHKIKELSENKEFLAKLEDVNKKFQDYMNYKDTWFAKHKNQDTEDMSVAYFSMEYGIGEGLPIYSGGLGMLSGDHLKTASDMGLPVIGVGLLYRKGYVQQVLNRDNWQVEKYPENDWYNMPVQVVKDSNGNPLKVKVDIKGETVKVGVWRVPIGRTSLYLLDTNLSENSPKTRMITDQLYGGDRSNRISQEIVLGIGGVRALRTMGLRPTVYHVNEGHSAFLLFERIRNIMKERNINFYQAREIVWASSVFTTHTPVMAGNEYFSFDLIKEFLENYSNDLGISFEEFLSLGKEQDDSMSFCMTVVALKLCAFLNGVSKLHSEVFKDMWRKIWPSLPRYEIPIKAITNGVHVPSWISHEHNDLYSEYIVTGNGSRFSNIMEKGDWSRIRDIDDKEYWNVHKIRKQKMINLVRQKLKKQYERLGADKTVLEGIDKVLKPEYLTIGFARRFATYKRATLLFRNIKRLAEIVNSKHHPVQFIFAGKAHPADSMGKEFIKQVAQYSMSKEFNNRIIFVEDYNMNVARYMVQGVDVWLNNPIRPLEASGTSGMKAVLNGALNLSILDGWWDEGYSPDVGWALGGSEHYRNDDERDYVESESVYNLIQKVVAPLYYDRGPDGLPHKWIGMAKKSISMLVPLFNTNRMVAEYYEKFYVHAHSSGKKLAAAGRTNEIASWRRRIIENWPAVKVSLEDFKPDAEIHSGVEVPIKAGVQLGKLSPEDVDVQVVVGDTDSEMNFKDFKIHSMRLDGAEGENFHYSLNLRCEKSGRHDFAVRVMPKHRDIVNPYMPLHIKWDGE